MGAGGIAGNADGDASLDIGASFGNPNNGQQFGPGGTAQGDVVVNGGHIQGMTSIGVGVSSGGQTQGSGMGAGNGSLAVSGGDVSTRLLSVGRAAYRNSSLGYAPDAAPSAVGVFTMTDGTLALGGGTGNGLVWVGSAESFESEDPPARPDGPNPVQADGRVELTDVVVTGNATAFVGRAFGFDDGPSTGTGRLDVLRGSVELGSLAVGVSAGEEEVAHGTVTLTDTSLDVTGTLSVGNGYEAQAELNAVDTDVAAGGDLFVSAFRNVIGTATVGEKRGIMRMQNGALNVGGRMQVGVQFQGGEGELHLDNVQASVAQGLNIGASSNFGTPFGNGVIALQDSELTVGGDAFVDGGTLQLTDGRMTVAGNLRTEFFNAGTGDYFDGASADSSISLARSLLEVGGAFGHGVDDLLSIALHGTVGGTEYGAIDADSVNLRGGALSVDIAFALTANEYVFDLIASAALDGILGDFASVDLLGLGS